MELQTVALDAGNYQLKVCDGTDPRSIRSVQYRLPKGVNALRSLRNSPIIEIADGTRWHVGSQAFKYSSQEQTVTQDKALLAKIHLYASLEMTAGQVRLIASHHSPDVYEETLKRLLVGEHSYKRNGVECSIAVESVEVVPEGLGAYWSAQRAHLIPERGYVIVIDLGGSSWLYRVIDSDGEIIAQDVGDRLGTYHLAKQIAADERLKAPLRKFGITSPDPGLVLDGFTRGHTYAETGISWANWLSEYRDSWFKNILGSIQSACTTYLPSTRRFIVCGGGAFLVEGKLHGKEPFVVLSDPAFANVIGMYQRYSNLPRLSIVA